MASVSVYRSNAMYALGTKTLTLPNQDPGWKSAPPTQLCNYHHNHCQQRPDWSCLGKVQTRCLPVKASSDHCWGCVKVALLPTLIVLPLQAWSTHPVLGQSLGYPAVPTKTASPLRFWTPHWPGAGLRPVPGENLEATFELNQTDLQLWRRNITTLTQLTTTGTKSDNEREICMAVYNGESVKVYDIKYTKMIH